MASILVLSTSLVFTEKAVAAGEETITIDATDDLSFDSYDYWPDGYSINELSNVHFVGYEDYLGTEYIASSALKFNIDSVNRNRQIEKVYLVVKIAAVYNTLGEPKLDIWSSEDNTWVEDNSSIPDPNQLIDTFTSFTNEAINKFDITSYFNSVSSDDNVISLVLKGNEEAVTPNPEADSKATQIAFYDKVYTSTDNSDAPHLEIIYAQNDPPTDIQLSSTEFPEDTPVDSVIGSFSATDSNSPEAFTYELVSGDTSDFAIVGNELFLKQTANFDEKSSYSIRVRVTDTAGNTYEEDFTITVLEVNGAPVGTITINSSAEYTNNRDVTLNLTADDPDGDDMTMQFSNDNITWSTAEPASSSTTKAWTLSEGDGEKTVYYRISDGSLSNTYSDTIILDTALPTGTLNINSGESITNNRNVTLDISTDSNGSYEMRFSNEEGSWSAWEPVTSTRMWELSSGDGNKTVNMELKDAAGNSSETSATIQLDTAGPTVTGVADGGIYNEDVTITFEEGDATLNGVPFASGEAISFEGSHNLIVKDDTGNTTTISFTIDKTAPILTFTINNNEAFTNNPDITLNISADDTVTGISGIAFSNNGTDWSAFEPYSETMNRTLPEGDGEKTVYIKVMDGAGNETQASQTITLDTTAPTGSFSITEGTHTNETLVHLAVTADDNMGPIQMQFSNDNSTWSGWQDVSETAAFTLDGNDGEKTIYMQLQDGAGNVSTNEILQTIVLDREAPVVTGVVEGQQAKSVAPVFSETNATLDGEPWSSGDAVTIEGPHTLIVTDLAGNKTTVTFIIDKTAPEGTIQVNNNDDLVNTTGVTLSISATDANGVHQMRLSNDGTTWDPWEDYSATKNWSLPTGDSDKTVYIELSDQAGNTFQTSDAITLDTTAPTGLIKIEGDKPYTNQTTVNLQITGDDIHGPLQVRFLNDLSDNSAWEPLEDLAGVKAWTLPVGDGLKTVYMQIQDAAGNVSTSTDEITLDQTAPTVTGVTEGLITNNNVTITFDGMGELDGEVFNSGEAVTLEGTHTFIVRDDAGNLTSITFTIDKTNPEGTLTINNGASITNDEDVKLSYSAADNLEGDVIVRFYNSKTEMSDPITVNETGLFDWTLPTGDGQKTVYMRIEDEAGNVSVVTYEIGLDQTRPTGTVTINAGAGVTNNPEVVLSITGNDANEPIQIRIATDTDNWTEWELLTPETAVTLPAGDGEKTILLELKDAAGNIYQTSDTIELDTTSPVVSGVTEGLKTKEDLTITFNEGTATLNEIPITNNHPVTSDGDYTLVVTDTAGNVTTVTFTIDKISPAGTVIINNGADYTASTTVAVSVTGTDARGSVEMRLSNVNGAWTGDWQPVGTVSNWTLTEGDGTKTVYVQLKDEVGNVTELEDSITIDMTAPVITGVTNGQKSNIDLTISFNEGTATLNDVSFTSGGTVSAEGNYTLKVTDSAGNETTVEFVIDKTAPTGTFTLNNHDMETLLTTVDIQITSTDTGVGELEMRFSNDTTTWSEWEPAAASKTWELDDTSYGEKTVYMEIKDGAGNITQLTDTIVYKSVPVLQDDTIEFDEDTDHIFADSDFSFTNVDGTPLVTIKILTLPENGLFQFGTESVKEEQEIAVSELSNLIYTPNENWYGSTAFTWNGTDGSNYAAEQATLTLQVNSINDQPVAESLEFTTTGGRPIEGMFKAEDIEKDHLTFEVVDEPERGELTIVAETGEFKFIPQAGNYRTLTFTYRAFDGTDYSEPATVTLTNRIPPAPPEKPVDVLINGVSSNINIETNESIVNDMTILSILFELGVFRGFENMNIDLEIKKQVDSIKADFSLEMLEELKNQATKLRLKTPDGSFQIPTQSFKQEPVLEYFDTSEGVQVSVQLQPTTDDLEKQVLDALGNRTIQTYIPPVQFEVNYTQNNEQHQIHQLDQAISMEIPLPEGVNPTFAAMLMPDGNLIYVPANFEQTEDGVVANIRTFTIGNVVFLKDEIITDVKGKLISWGILNQEDFTPETSNQTSRALFVEAMTKSLGLSGVEEPTFSDVPPGHYDIYRALAYSLISGYGNGNFKPEQPISREHVMVILSRALGLWDNPIRLEEVEVEATLSAFNDAELLQPWIREAAAVNIKLGIFHGNGNGEIMPKDNLTKNQLIEVLNRFMSRFF
ncbi:Ig-like domain repeat protein [Bacillus oleivorans]|uniref:Ig-like domain repeat protein n=1 Tax=Bacillus oleivorans TaxID=1448271 RepID=UPI000BE334A2|nr:Ig-like domain-containing protein [Bacillus oleivorans]